MPESEIRRTKVSCNWGSELYKTAKSEAATDIYNIKVANLATNGGSWRGLLGFFGDFPWVLFGVDEEFLFGVDFGEDLAGEPLTFLTQFSWYNVTCLNYKHVWINFNK